MGKTLSDKILVIILVLSFCASLFYSFYYKIIPVIDARAYDDIAINIMEGFGFKEDRSKSFEFDTSIVRAGPSYEYFLAGAYKIFGHHYEVIWILQAFLHALTAFLVYSLGVKIFQENGKKIGLIAAVFIGLHPDLIEISAMLMTETFYLFFITLVIWLFVKLFAGPDKLRYTIFLSLTTAVAILSRPPVILFVPIILVYYFINKRYKSAIIFLAGIGLVLAPWVIRNYLIYHQFILTTMIGEYNLWVGNTLDSNGGQIAGGFNPLTSYTDIYGFFDLKQKAGQEFWFFVFGHTFIFIKLCVIRTIRYFSLIRPMGFWFYQTGIKQIIFVVFSGVSIVALFMSGFTGMLVAFKEKKPLYYYLIAFALTSPLVLIPTVVQSRYRFQIYPFLALFGGYFLSRLFANDFYAKKIWLAVVIFFLIVSLADSFMFWPVVLERIKILI